MEDVRALASPDCTMILAGNKMDVAEEGGGRIGGGAYASSYASDGLDSAAASVSSRSTIPALNYSKATVSSEGREVPFDTASRWAGQNGIPVAVEVSAFSGENIDELFNRLARMILTKIELGEIDPDDPQSGIQYGDIGGWGVDDGNESIRSRGARRGGGGGQLREWEDVFRLSGSTGRRKGCC
jgi:Ras-related protein Rab-4B